MMELVVVMVLVATVAAIAGPRFFSAMEFQETFFRNDTLTALRYAQKLAVASGCEVRVIITSGGYSMNHQDGDPCSGAAYTLAIAHPGTGASGYANTAPNGISLSGDTPITFDALGRALNVAGNVADATVNVGGLSIEVIGETGFVYAP